MNISYTITLEGFTFDCIVTDYFHQPALGKWCDSDLDCYGYTDIEFNVISACHEDRESVTLDEIEELMDRIEEKLINEIEGEECYEPY